MVAGVCCLRFTRVEVALLPIPGDISGSRLCPVMMGYDRVLRQILRQEFRVCSRSADEGNRKHDISLTEVC